jgi:hypothetical protein
MGSLVLAVRGQPATNVCNGRECMHSVLVHSMVLEKGEPPRFIVVGAFDDSQGQLPV